MHKKQNARNKTNAHDVEYKQQGNQRTRSGVPWNTSHQWHTMHKKDDACYKEGQVREADRNNN